MTWGLVAVAGATVVGAVVSSNSANKSAQAQKDAANSSNATNLYMYDQTRADQQPYRDTGYAALPQIRELMGESGNVSTQDVLNDPGYQFGLNEGTKAVQGSAAARGGLYSGATLKALDRYGTDYATTKFSDVFNRKQAQIGNQFNRLSTAAGLGSAATSQVGQAGANYASNYGSNVMGAANAGGAARISSANSWTNALNQGASAFNNYNNPNKGAYSNFLNGYTNEDVMYN